MKYDEKYKSTYDPWNLLGLLRPSEHCKGKKERIVAYDHTGYAIWKCDCGKETGWQK